MIDVLRGIRAKSPATPTQVKEARLETSQFVANDYGVTRNTVSDNWIERMHTPTSKFDRLVLDWLSDNGNELRDLLADFTVAHPKDDDAVDQFFSRSHP